ncbi:MAG: alanine--tRNA ligase [Rhodobiaceae bacterium]|nr:alanine--tRNA ligase [Rhodobiaceae bacterium]
MNDTTNQVREKFLDFFKSNGHSIQDSGPLVPSNDPTLLFTNAGMVQFKNFFTGLEIPNSSRVATSQKCVRAGGKHNDLDNVGYTYRHHTFFEMLGNFSFGDYFKETSIELAWNLITKEYGLSQDKLIFTVYESDTEAFDLWKKISGLNDKKIIKMPTNDNFWSMGDTGPCGPCSEIFYDHGENISGGPPGSKDEDGDRFVEIWNLVFMQYEQINENKRVDLPNPSIDTGMGLERITAVMQGTHNNYKIDTFDSIINECCDQIKTKITEDNISSFRVIADHLRSTSFLIADGVLPSNEGRGYVLRRICRRATRHAELLGYSDPLLCQLVPKLINEMGSAFPELKRAESLIVETLRYEENNFRETLSRGLKILDNETKSYNNGDQISGEIAFKLYDTYGFPLDLTEDALRNRGISVNIDEFENQMINQKNKAKAAWSGSGDALDDKIWYSIKEEFGSTQFLGYEQTSLNSKIISIIVDNNKVNSLSHGQEAILITNHTLFYAESGGQVGDIGEFLLNKKDSKFIVNKTQKKFGSLHLHYGVMEGDVDLYVNDEVSQVVNKENRRNIAANHSATHILHESLRIVLGDHISQKGSLVNDKKLRFDFSHQKPLNRDQICEVEDIANKIVLTNTPITTKLMNINDAINTGARALFGEKYNEEVRVVSMGVSHDKTFSIELCGGTHAKNTGDIGMIKIISEQGVASGVRRLEAITGESTRNYFNSVNDLFSSASDLLKANQDDFLNKLNHILVNKKDLEKNIQDLKGKIALDQNTDNESDSMKVINNTNILIKTLHNTSSKELRSLMDSTKNKLGTGIIIYFSIEGGDKLSFIVGVTKDLLSNFNANEILGVVSKEVGSKGGGGRPDMAQAGGGDVNLIDKAIEKVYVYFGS